MHDILRKKTSNMEPPTITCSKIPIPFLLLLLLLPKVKNATMLIRGTQKILSENRTFELGFFNNGPNCYLGVSYSSIPTPTIVWVANRERPSKSLNGSTLEITETGRLAMKDTDSDSADLVLWESTNTESEGSISPQMKLLESGNLVLLNPQGKVLWQSFDHPTDTWLPGMNLTAERSLVSWRSLSDPSPGFYTLRLKTSDYGEFELVFNTSVTYWSTGSWTGQSFRNVPEMTVPYIYRFHFSDPFLPTASFGFTERPLESGLGPPLTRFRVEYWGQLQQYTLVQQLENWNRFWLRPEDRCEVYGLCGNLGICNSHSNSYMLCDCVSGYRPFDDSKWASGDYFSGCRRGDDNTCNKKDDFKELGFVKFEGAFLKSFKGSKRACQDACLSSCTCVGMSFDEGVGLCSIYYGSLLNLRNSTSHASGEDVFYVRVPRRGQNAKRRLNLVVLILSICVSVAVLGVMAVTLSMLKRRGRSGREDGGFSALNLKVFSHKQLQVATRGFSEKLGHGGFGTVFQGELPDSSIVAVKRLERPGGGEKEFRAEVCTIGNIQHVNLVRLRGFCSENSHRLLVYEYMPNGALSAYLRQDGPVLSWDVRFRVAIGTAKGIAYLHEECRDCIIHCDIKPENILLDHEFTAKVSDFGLAKLLGRDFSRVLATMRGTLGYVAPEWISGVAITTKADVYSYGMTLLELIGGRRNVETPPSDGGRREGDKWFFPPWAAKQVIEGNVASVIDTRLGNAYNIEEAQRVALIAVWCIQDNETARPAMGMVVKMLEGVVPVNVPPPPKLLEALVSGNSYHGIKADSRDGISTGGSRRSNVEVSCGGSESSLGDVSSSPLKSTN